LKRRKSAFLLVGHGPSGIALPTPAPFVYHAASDCRAHPPLPAALDYDFRRERIFATTKPAQTIKMPMAT
jgi:hypothetical protein